MTEGRQVQRLFRVTPPLGTRGPASAASTIPPLSVRPCGTRFSNTREGPNRCRSAPISDPLFRGFGIPNRSTASLVQRAGLGRTVCVQQWRPLHIHTHDAYVRLSMCVCAHAHARASVCLRVCEYLRGFVVCRCVTKCVCACMCVCKCLCVCLYVSTVVDVCMCAVLVCAHVCMCVCRQPCVMRFSHVSICMCLFM